MSRGTEELHIWIEYEILFIKKDFQKYIVKGMR